ncbi:cytoplasmic polyadenylation element-binding protein 2-like isoform X1 [Haliotis rubra]|uniref:cytoplasmic polyadenylation element-binding protein 2-like isoform X1 n=1 Tax=Haliotis rubra TaxID=36100 RepID=UPI001EE57521|nr:cytoplasmic polyadenylation element-binding protein 2-like isoform X1 [Haliotis rubra]
MGDFGLDTITNVRALSPVDFDQLANNQSLFASDPFPSVCGGQIMQDDTLLEKPASKQQSPKQLPVSIVQGNSTSEQNGDIVTNTVNGGLSEEKKNDMSLSSVTQLSIGLSEPSTTVVTSLSSAPNFWSTASADDTFVHGFQSLNGTVTFQQFPPAPNSVMNASFTGQHMSMNVPPPQRRAITAHHNFPQRQSPNVMLNNPKSYPNWSNAPQTSWSSQQNPATLSPWGNVQPNHQRRSVPNINALAPMKRATNFPQIPQSSFIAPSKFRRSTSFPGQIQQAALGMKPQFEYQAYDDLHRDGMNSVVFNQASRSEYNFSRSRHKNDRPTSFDTMRFPALESQLLDIMKTGGPEHFAEHMKGKSPFDLEENQLNSGNLDQTVPNIGTPPRVSPSSQSGVGDRVERFSRKVFVGGLPPDIDEEEITAAFRRFGPLVVDWPHKAESKSYFPPKGYCFLIFQDEMSVQALIESCLVDDDKLYWCVSSPTMKDKPVQIRPWNLSDSDFVMDGSQPLDPRKTIFVGGVPRPLRAVELAMIMDRLYGGVCYAGIDTDPELKYPKGAGRVAFSNQQSYIAAISARFVQLQHGDIDKRVEVKPYVLDDQMCDECQGARCGGKFAPFFCANVTCLQYYCEYCWAQIHSRPGREFHKPLVKEGADRPRAVPFRWC